MAAMTTMTDAPHVTAGGSDQGFDVRASTALKRRRFNRRHWLKAIGVLALTVALFYLALIGLYRFVNPPGSNLMLAQAMAGKDLKQEWVSLDEMSPHVITAVMMSEDARFCSHWGIDWDELSRAIERADDIGRVRGASTISMQTAKNLFLWPDRSFVRKAIEMPLAVVMDTIWSKPRMLEVYLNIAEWGPGIFGIGAAARHHFGKSASALGRREAALLAASLPNPHVRRAGRAGPRTRRKAQIIMKRMRGARPYVGCISQAGRG